MNKEFRKIRITGGSGSGKSYLAKLLSDKLGIKLTSIDLLIYDFSKDFKFSKENRRSDKEIFLLYNKILKKKSWIIEGGFFNKTRTSYDAADIIIFINPPMYRRLWNTFSRFFKNLFSGRYEGLLNFLRLTSFNIRTRNKWVKERVEEFKELYSDKLVLFSSADDAFDWFKEKYKF